MISEQLQLKEILDALVEKTDMMFNAIKVDAFEIFEDNLVQREALLESYQTLKTMMDRQVLRALGTEWLFKSIQSKDKLIKAELKRYQKQIQQEMLEVKVEKSKLQANQKKTNQYHFRTDATLSGNLFDKKK